MKNWDKKFIELTEFISNWSKDNKRKVGAIIVDDDNRILSVGYNGIPQGCDDDNESRYIKPKKNFFFEHAERNAIYSCAKNGQSCKDKIMYVTWYPCCDCARAIIQSGIKTLVCKEPDWYDDSWGESFRFSKEMLYESNINVIFTK